MVFITPTARESLSPVRMQGSVRVKKLSVTLYMGSKKGLGLRKLLQP